MESPELIEWRGGPVGVLTIPADERGVVTIGNDECCVEIELEFSPMTLGHCIFRHCHDNDGDCHEVPVCFVWRYPTMN